jgi:hypothetical protein
MKENNMNYRHGEIVLKKVTKVGEGKTSTVKSYIVGHSETGHHHVLESTKPYTVTKDKLGKLWLQLEAEAKLVHQKSHDVHNTLTIPAGIYEVGQKTEYNPFTRSIEAVRD